MVFHNLKGFDSHLIIQGLDKDLFKSIKILPHTIEKYLALFLDNFIFIDSYAFLPLSLDCLARNASEEYKKNFLRNFFREDDLAYCMRKAVLPYDYISSEEKLAEPLLQPKEAFYNRLKDEHISQ